MDFYNYGYTKKDEFDWLKQHAHRFSHYAVLQTDLRPKNFKDGVLSEDMLYEVKKRNTFFLNRFFYQLYGRKSHYLYRKKSRYKNKKKLALPPVVIPIIEGVRDNNDPAFTTHINLLIGNLPANLSQNEITAIISDCWIKAGGNSFTKKSPKKLKDTDVFVSRVDNKSDVKKITNYLKKEYLASLDVENIIL